MKFSLWLCPDSCILVMRLRKPLLIVLCVCSLILAFGEHHASRAADGILKPIKLPFTVFFGSLYWSYDSQSLLVYYEPGDTGVPDQPRSIAYEYDLKTGVATRSSAKESHLDLGRNRPSKQDETLFHPAPGSAQISSPNGRYLTYVPIEKSGPKSDGAGYPISIGDRQTGRWIETFSAFWKPSVLDYRVLWNRTSSTYAISGFFGGDIGIYGLSETRWLNRDASSELRISRPPTDALRFHVTIEGKTYFPQWADPFALSDDGQWVLMLLGETASASFRRENDGVYLAQVNLHAPASTTLIKRFDGRQVYAATFDRQDETVLWIVDGAGLHRYDMRTRTSVLISTKVAKNSDIDFSYVRSMLFSPDRKWLAWVRNNPEIVGGEQDEVFLMALP